MLKLFPKKWFLCVECGGIWMKETSDEELDKEYKENFPNDPNREFPIDIICDDCYKEFKPQLDNLTPEKRKEIEQKFEKFEIPKEFEKDLEKLTKEFVEKFIWDKKLIEEDPIFNEKLDISEEEDNIKKKRNKITIKIVLDWVGTFLIIIGTLLIASKNAFKPEIRLLGLSFYLISNIAWTPLAFLIKRPGLLLTQIVLFIINLNGIIKLL